MTEVIKNIPEDCCISLCVDETKPTPGCAEQDTKPENATCIFVCDGVVPCSEAVGPCGKEGFVDVTTLNNNLSGCDSGPIFTVINDYDKSFISNAYYTGSVLTWVTAADAPVKKFTEISSRVVCKNANGKKLSYVFKISIGIKDLCDCVDCGKCEECDPCTGECVPDGTGSISIT